MNENKHYCLGGRERVAWGVGLRTFGAEDSFPKALPWALLFQPFRLKSGTPVRSNAFGTPIALKE
jgi:hypothetical protein